MQNQTDISGVNVELDDRLRKYVEKVATKIKRYIPRNDRAATKIEVKLKESKKQKNKQCMAEFIVHMPHEKITASASTINLYAAIDVVEKKLRNQMKKYKDTHADPRFYQRVAIKFRRKNPGVDKR